jgi:hypothetical protein
MPRQGLPGFPGLYKSRFLKQPKLGHGPFRCENHRAIGIGTDRYQVQQIGSSAPAEDAVDVAPRDLAGDRETPAIWMLAIVRPSRPKVSEPFAPSLLGGLPPPRPPALFLDASAPRPHGSPPRPLRGYL